MIDLYIDFKSPASYLAMKPTLALIDELGIPVAWHPYNTKQETIPAEKKHETKSETHFRIRAKRRRKTHLHYASVQDISMVFPDVPGTTDLALAALETLTEDPRPFIKYAFEAYWGSGADLNDATIVRELLSNSGLDISAHDLNGALERLASDQLKAEENGIVDAPAYVVDGHIFIGREHLPWIRTLLEKT